MQVKELNQSILELPDWAHFLRRSSLLIAAVLLGSALIMAVAANWLSWPKVGRIALILVTITALVVFALRTGLQKPKDWASGYSLSSLSVNLAAIAIGGLFALIGQSYQTGADPWQLFALWALLLLPWLITLRSLFIILLVLTITNVALLLFFAKGQETSLFAMLVVGGFNLFVLYGSQRCRGLFYDPLLLLRRISMLFLIGAVLGLSSIDWLIQNDNVLLQKLLGLIVLGGLSWYYLRRQQDVLTGALGYGGCYLLVISWLINSFVQAEESVLLIFFISTILGMGLIFDLRRIWRQQSSTQEKRSEPWFLRLIYLGIQIVITLFFLLVWWLFVGTVTDVMIHVYVLFSVIAIIWIQQKNQVITQDLPVFLLLSSMALAAFGLDNLKADNHILLAWFLILNIVVYLFSPHVWLVRFCSALMATALAIIWSLGPHPAYALGNGNVAVSIQLCMLSVVIAAAALMHKKPTYQGFLRPLWLAWVCMLLWLVGSSVLGFFFSQSGQTALIAGVISALPPLVLMRLLWQQHSLWFSIGCAAVLGVISIFGLLNIPLANLALLGWIWAYAQRDRLLFFGAVFLLLSALGLHYYALQWPLISKAGALAVGGLGLGLSAWVLHRFVIHDVAPLTQAQMSLDVMTSSSISAGAKHISIGLLVGLAAVWLISVQDVGRKEYLLANGQPVILKLAPVDPRSLMQGDYMALNFDLSQQLDQISSAHANLRLNHATTLLVYIQPSQSMQSTLVALKNPLDQSIYWIKDKKIALEDLAVLKMQRKHGRWLPNGVDAWFFPEGHAAHFEQAQYGEFKTDIKGNALLYQLLDAKVQPLAAPAQIKTKGF